MFNLVAVWWKLSGTYGTSGVAGRGGGGSCGVSSHMRCGRPDGLKGTIRFFREVVSSVIEWCPALGGLEDSNGFVRVGCMAC